VRVAAVAATLYGIAQRRAPAELAPPGWRNVPSGPQTVTYQLGDGEVVVAYRPVGDRGIELELGGKRTSIARFEVAGDRLWLVEGAGHRRAARVAAAGARIWVLVEGALLAFTETSRFPAAAAAQAPGGLTAPMPGRVVKLLVEVGQEVAAGTPLVVLEAMKMEHTVRAATGGRVHALGARVGQQVDADFVLAVIA
jgi:biotin carboxyl carrier protein